MFLQGTFSKVHIDQGKQTKDVETPRLVTMENYGHS